MNAAAIFRFFFYFST
ncbi:pheST operon leader peptide PheM [Salmonella enterica]|nr:pheST operon leader peptide PheM [Salmonella enterica]ELL7460551.1 pheST operon leader peptide PheM [Salmonella enterica]